MDTENNREQYPALSAMLKAEIDAYLDLNLEPEDGFEINAEVAVYGDSSSVDFLDLDPLGMDADVSAPPLEEDDIASGIEDSFRAAPRAAQVFSEPIKAPAAPLPHSLHERLKRLDAGFSETLLTLIDEQGLSDADIYKKAGLSRQHFSKIRKDPKYRPTKNTALALSVALELPLPATQDLLARAGYTLSHANPSDVIVEYFIINENFDLFAINAALYEYDQPLLS